MAIVKSAKTGSLRTGKELVTAYQLATSSRSVLECAVPCAKYSHCNSVAFEPASGTCYLGPAWQDGAGNGRQGVRVVEKKGQWKVLCFRCFLSPTGELIGGGFAVVVGGGFAVVVGGGCGSDGGGGYFMYTDLRRCSFVALLFSLFPSSSSNL